MTHAFSEPPTSRIRWKATNRLIPSRYPSVGLFDRVASAEDLDAVLEIEAWTNDRISAQLGIIHRVPRDEWLVGQPMASVVMAAFCHPRPGGARFSSTDRGAWYAARSVASALAESVHSRTRELAEVGHFETRMQMRLYHADFNLTCHDLRGQGKKYAACYDPDSYSASQKLADELLEAGSNGIVYDSVRHAGGECIACFRPRLVTGVRVVAHYEYPVGGNSHAARQKALVISTTRCDTGVTMLTSSPLQSGPGTTFALLRVPRSLNHVQLRADTNDGFSAMRLEIRTGDQESRDFMRILHEETRTLIATMGEERKRGRPRRS